MRPDTTEDVFDLMDAYIVAAALGTALELGLFWLLAEQPLDTEDVARALGIPLNRCWYWLEILAGAGLVEQVTDGYAPSETARTAILDAYSQETWAFLAGEARDRFPAVCQLARHIGEPGSVWVAQGLTPPDYFAQLVASPERARRFTRMLYELHLPLADTLAEALDMSGVERMLDLGGGSGVASLALLRRYAHLLANGRRQHYEEDTYIDHRNIFNRLVQGEVTEAKQAMAEHIQASMNSVIEAIEKRQRVK